MLPDHVDIERGEVLLREVVADVESSKDVIAPIPRSAVSRRPACLP
jgi:hypothetical protein